MRLRPSVPLCLLVFAASCLNGAPTTAIEPSSSGGPAVDRGAGPAPVAGRGGSVPEAGGAAPEAGGRPGGPDGSAHGGADVGSASGDAEPDRPGVGIPADAAGVPADAAGAERPATVPVPVEVPLDCGTSGVAIESHGPVANRVNYVVLGDGYVAGELDSTYLMHVSRMVTAMFSERNEPYRRYRRFINICALKVPSNESGVDGDGKLRDTAFDGRGDDQSRLGIVNGTKVRAAITRLLPHTMDVDWRAVVMNSNQWWHSGGSVMVWSGGDGGSSAEAAVHEGGHSFHRLGDEYDTGGCRTTREPTEINVTADPTGQLKWKEWLNFNQVPGTGVQRPFEGGYYCKTGIWRPSSNSKMRTVSVPFNSISREKIIRDIYGIVSPIDATTPPAGPVANAADLRVKVVDPAVIKVEWSVDGQVMTADGGETFQTSTLAPGTHAVVARAYDDTPWLRGDRARLQKVVQWMVTVP